MDEVTIKRLDHYGRGIAYVNDKITFVTNALPDEVVKIKIVKETKKYQEAIVIKYVKTSSHRQKPICPYFNKCSSCHLMHMTYEDTLKFKQEKVRNILNKYANLDCNIDIIASPSKLNYRNKITLKVVNRKIGYYKEGTHQIIPIHNCMLANKKINDIIKKLPKLNIINGEVIIRNNYNDEIMLNIVSNDNIDYKMIENEVSSLIINNKIIYNDNKYIEIINNLKFQVSYNSFFQINRDICSILFSEINNYVDKCNNILDLYCGVGTLGLSISSKVKNIYGVEVIDNAIINAKYNAKINNVSNTTYYCGKVENIITKLPKSIDVVIVDPPREGLDKTTKNELLKFNVKKIIYISCDPITLARDIKDLSSIYNLDYIKALDMFPYTYHVECVCVLKGDKDV